MSEWDNTHESLDWLAFRYVSGELDAAEEAAFEERLLVDLSACEAVAAVQGTVTIVRRTTACPSPVDVLPVDIVRASPALRGARWARGIAASLLVVGLFGLAVAWRPAGSRPAASQEMDVAMVVAWTAGADALADGVVNDDADVPSHASPSSAELEVPGWLVTALEHAAENDDTLEN